MDKMLQYQQGSKFTVKHVSFHVFLTGQLIQIQLFKYSKYLKHTLTHK